MAQEPKAAVWAERVPAVFKWEEGGEAVQRMMLCCDRPPAGKWRDLDYISEGERRGLDYILEVQGVGLIQKTGLYVLDFEAMNRDRQNYDHDLEDFLVEDSWLEEIRKTKLFDHPQAIRILNALGEICEDGSDFRYQGDYVGFLGFIFPSAFWSEVLLLKRALWLLDNLGPNLPKIIERTYEQPWEGSPSGQIFQLRWPQQLCHEYCRPIAPPPAANIPEFVGPLALQGLLNAKLSQSGVYQEIRFDRSTGSFERRPVGKSPGAALWELLSRRAVGIKAAIRCKVCGTLVEAKRSTRKYCSHACGKQAQRLGISKKRAAG